MSHDAIIQETSRRHLAIEDELRGYISERDRRITDLEAKVAAAEDAMCASHELLLRSAEAIDRLQTDKARLIEYVLIARPALPSFDEASTTNGTPAAGSRRI